MASDTSNDIGGSVSLDTTNFKAGVTDLNRQIRVIESGFKAAAAGMDDWGKSEEGLKLKINSLNQVTDIQKQKVANLTQQYKEVVAAKGEDSKEAQNLQVRINNETASLNKNLKELSNTSEALKNFGKDSKEASDNIDDLNKKSDESGNSFKELSSNLLKITGIAAIGKMAVDAGKSILGFSSDSQKAMNDFQAQTGTAAQQMQGFKSIADEIYADNFGESMDDIAQSMAQINQTTGQTGNALKSTTEDALLLRDAFGFEVSESINTVNGLMQNFGITAEQAYTLVAQGAQNGANKNGDLLDIMNEYGVQFAKLGLNAEDFTNILISGAQQGAFQIDKVGDAVKEFAIRAIDGSNTTQQGFQQIGLNADEMSSKISKGGDSAKQAFNQTLDALLSMSDPLQQQQAGVALFGTQFEDLGVKGITALRDIGDNANMNLDTLGKLNDINDDVGSALEGLKRQLIESIGKPIGEEITPKINDMINSLKNINTSAITNSFGWIINNASAIAGSIGTIVAAWAGFKVGTIINTAVKGMITFTNATKDATLAQAALSLVMDANPIGVIVGAIAGLTAGFIYLWNTSSGFRDFFIGIWAGISSTVSGVVTGIVNFFTSTLPIAFNNFITFISQLPSQIGSFFMQLPSIIGNLFMQALTAIVNWGANVVTWVATAIPNIITSIGTFFSQLPANIGYALGFVLGTLAKWGADAAVWVATNLPILIGNIVNFFLELPGKIWDVLTNVISRIGEWGSNIIAWATANLPTIIGNIITFFASLPGKLWDILVSAVQHIAQWGSNIISWAAANLPGVISNIVSFFKSLPKSLLDIGVNLVKGLWNGITSMAKWVRDKIGEFAKGVVKGFKDALGIKSPSRIMREEVGVYVSSGVAQGIVDGIPKVVDSVAQVAKGIENNKGLITNAVQGVTDNMSSNIKITNTSTIANVITQTDTNDTDKINEQNGQSLNASLGKGLTDSTNKVTTPINNLASTVDTTMSNMATSMNKTGQDVDTNLGTGVTNNANATINPVNAVIATVTNNVKTFTQSCIGHGQDTDTNLGAGVTGNSTAVTGAINNVISTVGNSLTTFATGAVQYGQNTDTSIASGITNTAGAVTGAMNSLLSNITSILNTFVNSCTSIGTEIVNSIGSGIKSSENNLTSIVHELTQKVINAFTGPDGFDIHSPSRKLFEIGSNVIQGFINGLSSKDALAFFQSKIGGAISSVSGNVSSWLSTALALTGTPMSWLPGLLKLTSYESGDPGTLGSGNPALVNSVPVGNEYATGLLQMLPSTFREFMQGGFSNILNPIDNAIAAIRYIKNRYGSVYNTPLFTSGGAYMGYASGTNSAKAGLAAINEKGWEFVDFSGGEMVLNNKKSIELMNQATSAINAMNAAMSGLNVNTQSISTSTTTSNSSSNISMDGDLNIILTTPDGKVLAQQVLPWVDIMQGKNLRKKKKGVTG